MSRYRRRSSPAILPHVETNAEAGGVDEPVLVDENLGGMQHQWPDRPRVHQFGRRRHNYRPDLDRRIPIATVEDGSRRGGCVAIQDDRDVGDFRPSASP